jgi:flagellar motor component MotA
VDITTLFGIMVSFGLVFISIMMGGDGGWFINYPSVMIVLGGTMGAFAPAIGMLGTIIGLVQMLMQMDDPSKIGAPMAVALLTTFYGTMLANLLFLPVAGKLKTRSKQEVLIKQMILEGVISIQSGDNHRVVEQKLKAFIAPKARLMTGAEPAKA